MRDRGADYGAAGVRVLGVSPDPVEAVIGADGTIARVFPKVSPKTHDDVVLEALADLAVA